MDTKLVKEAIRFAKTLDRVKFAMLLAAMVFLVVWYKPRPTPPSPNSPVTPYLPSIVAPPTTPKSPEQPKPAPSTPPNPPNPPQPSTWGVQINDKLASNHDIKTLLLLNQQLWSYLAPYPALKGFDSSTRYLFKGSITINAFDPKFGTLRINLLLGSTLLEIEIPIPPEGCPFATRLDDRTGLCIDLRMENPETREHAARRCQTKQNGWNGTLAQATHLLQQHHSTKIVWIETRNDLHNTLDLATKQTTVSTTEQRRPFFCVYPQHKT